MRIQSPVLFVNQRLHLLLRSVLGKYDILDRQNNGEKTMYEYLKGIITKITAKYIVLEANGIGYILHVANPYAYSGQVNQETQIYVHQVVREDAHLLYGFRSEDEKKLFLSLISVSGIGPVSALAIIAADDNAGLVQAIETKNITYLTKFPKIGKKTASKWCWTWKAR